jgi:hypothetical protein
MDLIAQIFIHFKNVMHTRCACPKTYAQKTVNFVQSKNINKCS